MVPKCKNSFNFITGMYLQRKTVCTGFGANQFQASTRGLGMCPLWVRGGRLWNERGQKSGVSSLLGMACESVLRWGELEHSTNREAPISLFSQGEKEGEAECLCEQFWQQEPEVITIQ